MKLMIIFAAGLVPKGLVSTVYFEEKARKKRLYYV